MDFKKLAKVITMIENEDERVEKILKNLKGKDGNAWVIGITGPPGSGKSTLIEKLTILFRREGKTVGIIAIDPVSPITKGAFLGDRIRMKKLFLDDGVFIRSIGSVDGFEGINPFIFDIIEVMDSFGFDVIIVETTGVGQSEVGVSYVADIVVVILAPNIGDEIQFMKAGIMEIGDIYVVNKVDLPETKYLIDMLKRNVDSERIISTCALREDSVKVLKRKLEEVKEYLKGMGEIERRKKRRILKQAEYILRDIIRREIENVKHFDDPRMILMSVLKRLCDKFL